MNGIGSGKKLLLTLVFLTVLVSPAAAEWNLTVSDHTNTGDDSIFFSEGQKSIIFVELTDEQGDPILPSDITDASDVIYTYNKSDGSSENMTHFSGAYWYAEFEADQSKHGISGNKAEILFEAQGNRNPNTGTDSGGWQNDTAAVTVGNYTVELQDEIPSKVVPGNEVNMSVNVTMRGSSENVNDSDVDAFFKNSSESQHGVDFTYNETEKLYSASVPVPESYESEYMMSIIAQNRSKNYENSYGATTTFIETVRELKGKVQDLRNIQGCETVESGQDIQAAECEPGATFEAVYNVTGAEADNVTVSGYRRNISSNELENYFEKTMDQNQEGLYTSEVEIPDINTSAYDKETTIKFNVTRNDRNHVDVFPVDYTPLEVIHTGTRSTVQGQAYDLSIQTVKPKSLTPWSESRIETVEVNVTDSEANTFGSYNLSNLTFDDQEMAFEEEIMIPEQASTGRWNLDIRASDIYGEVREADSGFSVSSSEQTFAVNDTVFEKEEEGYEEFNMTVENLVGSEITLNTNVSEGLGDQVNISESLSISDPVENVTVAVNLSAFEAVEGHVNFTDAETGYNRTVDLGIDVRSCQFSAGDVCSLTGKWVNVTADSRGNYTEEVIFQNNAEDGNATNLTTEVSGNISDLVEVRDLYTVEDELPVQINYTVDEAGNYTGNIEFEPDNSSSSLVFNTSLETTFEQNDEKGLVTASNLDLGTVPSETDRVQELDIQNNGNIEVQNVEASSSEFSTGLNVSDLNISGGDTETVGLEFENITTEEGQVNISGNTSEGLVSSVISVNASTVENYSAKTSELESRIEDLRPVRGSNLTRTLSEVSDSVEDIEQNWSEGNYMTAKNLYQEGQNRLDWVSNQDNSDDGSDDDQEQDDPPSNEGGTGESDDPDSGGSENSGTGSNQENSDGGLPIIPIVIFLVVLGIAGFVFYESYIPEEGDPLYGILGDEE